MLHAYICAYNDKEAQDGRPCHLKDHVSRHVVSRSPSPPRVDLIKGTRCGATRAPNDSSTRLIADCSAFLSSVKRRTQVSHDNHALEMTFACLELSVVDHLIENRALDWSSNGYQSNIEVLC